VAGHRRRRRRRDHAFQGPGGRARTGQRQVDSHAASG
jgi:hypothetical protein